MIRVLASGIWANSGAVVVRVGYPISHYCPLSTNFILAPLPLGLRNYSVIISNYLGQLVFTILSAVAEQERTRIRERISEAKLKTRTDGKYQGGKAAFGYSKDRHGNLIKDEIQQRCLVAMRT